MSFSVTRATTEDIPGIIDVWYASFNNPDVLKVFPDTPVVRNNWCAPTFIEMLKDPKTTVMIVIQELTSSARPRVVSYSVYRKHDGGPFDQDWHSRWPVPIVEGMSEDVLGPMFFDPMVRQHVAAMGERPHYFLEVLGTHEDFRKQGLGGMLLQWGYDAADREGVEMYLDAMKLAQPLYEKYGYVAQDYRDPKSASVPMRRPLRRPA